MGSPTGNPNASGSGGDEGLGDGLEATVVGAMVGSPVDPIGPAGSAPRNRLITKPAPIPRATTTIPTASRITRRRLFRPGSESTHPSIGGCAAGPVAIHAGTGPGG